jgi:hypothetical protein
MVNRRLACPAEYGRRWARETDGPILSRSRRSKPRLFPVPPGKRHVYGRTPYSTVSTGFGVKEKPVGSDAGVTGGRRGVFSETATAYAQNGHLRGHSPSVLGGLPIAKVR